ncbi:MAG: DEAD/DEAH box helicase family protein [Acholeplasmatales bacterium]|nr:DEAD/DEAH box helicase family protein [Acholeplasmatales bacterium]
MSRIKVTNTAIIIEDYELGSNEKLEAPYKVFDPIYHRFNYFGLYYDKDTKKLYIHGGNNLWRVKNALEERYYDRISNHPYQNIDNILIKYPPRDNEQLTALRFMCDVDEYQDNSAIPFRVVALNTGKGKTYCSIATIAYYKIKSMVITGSNSLLDQWESEILKYTNLSKNDVVHISGSNICNMILSGNSPKYNNAKIYLCSHGTLRSFGDTYGWDKVYRLFELLGIGIKIFDEAHTNFNNVTMIDFFTNVWRTYYVTATPGRSNWKENRIFQISLSQVPLIDLFDEDKDPHTSYIAIKYNSRPSANDISRCKNKYGLDRMKYIDYITKKPEFYDMLRVIMDMALKVLFNKNPEKRGKVLIYIGTNDGILRVYHWLGTNYPELLGDIGIFTSLLPHDQKMKERQKKLLLSTTKSAGLGEHIDKLKMTIVLAEPFKSEIIARQTLGRTRDNGTWYIEVVDMGFTYVRKFYFDKLPTFNKYALDVSDSYMDSFELEKRAKSIVDERDDWRKPAFALDDNRFDFDSVLPKKREDLNTSRPAVTFHKNNKKKFFED